MDILGYINGLITGCIALGAIWGFRKVLKEIKTENDTEHDRRKKVDNAVKVIEEKETLWDKGLADMEQGRKDIITRYDGRLGEQDAKIQQIVSMMCMVLRAQDAILEALVESGIGNGDIKAMHKELKGFIMDQVK